MLFIFAYFVLIAVHVPIAYKLILDGDKMANIEYYDELLVCVLLIGAGAVFWPAMDIAFGVRRLGHGLLVALSRFVRRYNI